MYYFNCKNEISWQELNKFYRDNDCVGISLQIFNITILTVKIRQGAGAYLHKHYQATSKSVLIWDWYYFVVGSFCLVNKGSRGNKINVVKCC